MNTSSIKNIKAKKNKKLINTFSSIEALSSYVSVLKIKLTIGIIIIEVIKEIQTSLLFPNIWIKLFIRGVPTIVYDHLL